MSFLLHYNIKRKLRVLNYSSHYDKIPEHDDKYPEEFKENPNHKIMGLKTHSKAQDMAEYALYLHFFRL